MKSILKIYRTLPIKYNLIFILFLISCGPNCSNEDVKIINAAKGGEIEIVRKYLEDGGDPLLTCHNYEEGKVGTGYNLPLSIALSDSKELLRYYLAQDIPDDTKNEMLDFILPYGNISLIKILIDNDAHISRLADLCTIEKKYVNPQINMLIKLDYNINWVDPSDGNTLLMKYCLCPALDESKELINTLKFLIDNGAHTDLINNNGNSIIDLTVNKNARQFLINNIKKN